MYLYKSHYQSPIVLLTTETERQTDCFCTCIGFQNRMFVLNLFHVPFNRSVPSILLYFLLLAVVFSAAGRATRIHYVLKLNCSLKMLISYFVFRCWFFALTLQRRNKYSLATLFEIGVLYQWLNRNKVQSL